MAAMIRWHITTNNIHLLQLHTVVNALLVETECHTHAFMVNFVCSFQSYIQSDAHYGCLQVG